MVPEGSPAAWSVSRDEARTESPTAQASRRHLFVVGPTPPHKGGIAHFNSRMLRELQGMAQVTAVGLASYPGWFRQNWSDPSRSSSLGTRAEPMLHGARPSTWVQVARKLHQARPDRLLLHWAQPLAAPMYWYLMQSARRVPNLSVELIVHNVIPHERRRLGSLLARAVFSRTDRFVVHGRSEQQRLRPWVGQKPITLAFHPVYDIFPPGRQNGGPELIQRLNLRRGPVLLFFGFIRPYKGLDVLLHAMPEVLRRFPDATLLIAGETFGGGQTDLLSRIESLGIQDSVRFENRYLPNEEVADYFAVADVGVFPYLDASQSGALQVAYAYDKPVVASRVGGLEESVEDGVSGWTCPPGSAPDLAAALIRALENPIPAASVRQFRGRFTWNRYCQLLMDEPSKVLTSARGRA